MRESAGISELHHLFFAIYLQHLHLSSTSRAVRDGCRGGGVHHKLLTVDQCLNWIRKELFACGGFLVIFG